MHAAGVADFSMADIYHPTFKRTKVHLSALINLCKFWAEQHGIYEVCVYACRWKESNGEGLGASGCNCTRTTSRGTNVSLPFSIHIAH